MRTRRLASRILAASLVLALAAGSAPADEQKAPEPAPPAKAERAADATFDRLFQEGVEHMKQGRAHEAIIVLEAARKRQPKVPEVSANLGFIHLAAKNYEAAQRDFEQALIVSPQQVNAYWGLALAMEGQGDLELALGAMRTFSHLEKADSPFQRKADAAIWEWEEQLRVKRGGEPTPIPPGSVTLDGRPVTSPEQLRKDYQPPEKQQEKQP